MALLIKSAFLGYSYVFNDLADYRTKDWFMVKSPFSVAALLGAYLMFVRHVGPKYMKERPPFNIDKILIAYNTFQVLLCSWLVYNLFPPCWNSSIFCEEVTDSDKSTQVAHIAYVYYWTKIIDLLDTVFFVLKKNTRQITFLHVYHHSLMVSYVWYVTKFYPGGQFMYIGFVNSFVHVIMYGYYLLTVYDQSLKKSLWWKKHITQLQLVQFFFYSLLFLFPMLQKECNFPKGLCVLILPQVTVMTFLFADFYYKTYLRKKAPAESGKRSVGKGAMESDGEIRKMVRNGHFKAEELTNRR